MHCVEVFLEAGEGRHLCAPGWLAELSRCRQTLGIVPPSCRLLWGQSSRVSWYLWVWWGVVVCGGGGGGWELTMPPTPSPPAPSSFPLSAPLPPLKNKKRKKRKNRKVSLEDYCHTAVTVTVPCGQYGGGIGGGRMVGWGGGGQLNTTPLHSLSLSLTPPPTPLAFLGD